MSDEGMFEFWEEKQKQKVEEKDNIIKIIKLIENVDEVLSAKGRFLNITDD